MNGYELIVGGRNQGRYMMTYLVRSALEFGVDCRVWNSLLFFSGDLTMLRILVKTLLRARKDISKELH
jgi:hypothetical protein